MAKQYKRSLFLFHRDLRLIDNVGLHQACSDSEKVACVFIFDPRQIKSNEYKSNNAVQFMIESLRELQSDISRKKGRLYVYTGKTGMVIKKLLKTKLFDAVYTNRDYTPFARDRDADVFSECTACDVAFHYCDDALLNPPEAVMKKDGDPYSIFTPYYKKARPKDVASPQSRLRGTLYATSIPGMKTVSLDTYMPTINKEIYVHGGRTNALGILRNIKTYKNYKQIGNDLAKDTTLLSAHNKFGTVSIREVFHAIRDELGSRHELLRQLYWRDFFTMIAYYHPRVFGKPFHKKYEKISWSRSKKNFTAWQNGQTGFPIVDAGMRQLNATGYMPNRARMIVASFLVKDLHIDWRWGEKYFAQQLVDYDPAVNNGNWQWVASTGCDAQPYFRIFNPWSQQKKFDKDAEYIKTWVPELRDVDVKVIHTWYKNDHEGIEGYPRPMVDHSTQAKKAQKMFS